MGGLTIGEVARRAGLRPSALRFYERSGLLPAPTRVGGQRRYDPTVLRRLTAIRLAQGAGFTVAEIRTLLNDFPPDTPPATRWRALGAKKAAELDARIANLQGMKRLLEEGAHCPCATLDDCPLVEHVEQRTG